MSATDYVLITPARNEEAYIEKTIASVVSQTVRPRKWVIVSDGSVDGTEEIVRRAILRHDFIQLLCAGRDGQRNFGSKVKAFQAGCECVKDTRYEFVGNLDADVSFASDYYEQVLERLRDDPNMGIAGGIIQELINNQFVPQKMSSNSVAGAVQLFRRECYEAIGGYIPIKTGGIDAAAEIMARTRGWTVRTFSDLPVYHHRRVSTGRTKVLSTKFYQGVTNYLLGYHPLFQVMSSAYRLADRPYVVGSVAMLLGYGWASLRRPQRSMPEETIQFLRSEQMARMSLMVRGAVNRQHDPVRN